MSMKKGETKKKKKFLESCLCIAAAQQLNKLTTDAKQSINQFVLYSWNEQNTKVCV